jgi:hypothetical protein
MTKAVWGAGVRLAGVLVLTIFSTSCGDLTRQGTASSYLIIRQLSGVAADGSTGNTLDSDVLTVIDDVPTIVDDPGSVTFGLGMKDTTLAATSANWITVERYHVTYVRADGRNTPGVDVPYPFDGAFTLTVAADSSSGFIWVRHQAKAEAPLAALARSGVIISTLAEITFYGHDQTGREVSATGHMTVSFGNYGDK